MKRIDTATAEPDLHGAGKAGFRDGDPPSALAPTRLNADFCNGVQEETVNVIEGAGLTPDGDDLGQMWKAIRALGLMNALGNAALVLAAESGRVFNDITFGSGAGQDGEGIFCAVGYNATGGVHSMGYAAGTGQSWSDTDLGANDKFFGIAHGDGLFVLVGSNSAQTDSMIRTSPDDEAPLILTEQTAAASTTAPLRKVCWNGTVWCAVGDYIDASNNSQIQTGNASAVTWTKRAPASSSTADFGACAARTDTGVICIGGTGGAIQRSTNNGVTWTEVHTDGAGSDQIDKLLYVSGDVWLALSETSGQSKVKKSIDNGVTWTNITLTANVDLGGALTTVQAYGLCNIGSAVACVMRPQGEVLLAQVCISLDQGDAWLTTGRIPIMGDLSGFDAFVGLASDGHRAVFTHEDGFIAATHAVAVAP